MVAADYTVSVSKDGKYILVDVKQPMTSELGRRCGMAAAELGRAHDIRFYLFDLRGAPNIQSVLPNYEFAYNELQSFGFPKDTRSALLTDPHDRSHDFMETLFMNAGYNVRLFTDETAALTWLER